MEQDQRRVQTAVMATPDSPTPAYMPLDQDEAETFQEQARQAADTFWCGTLLGGCGSKLSIKIYRARKVVPHFAHHNAAHQCVRHALGAESADHLYAAHQLRTWAQTHNGEQLHPRYIGDFDQGKGCDQLLLTSTDEHTKQLRLVFTPTLSSELKTLATSTEGANTRWLVKDNPSLVRALIEHQVPFHRFRLTTHDLTRVLEVRTIDATGTARWFPPEAALTTGAREKPEPPTTGATTTPGPAVAQHKGLDAALRGLEHSLAQGTRKDIGDFSDRVRRHLAAPNSVITPQEREQAQHLLAQASEALRKDGMSAQNVDLTQWRQQVKTRQEQARQEQDRRRGADYQRRKARERKAREAQVREELRRIEELQEETKALVRQLRAAWADSEWETYKSIYRLLTRIRRMAIAPQHLRDQIQNVLKELPYVGDPLIATPGAYTRQHRGTGRSSR